MTNSKGDHPFASIFVLLVFPDRLDAVLEEVVVGVHLNQRWLNEVICVSPEHLCCADNAKLLKVALIELEVVDRTFGGKRLRSGVVPECPSVLKTQLAITDCRMHQAMGANQCGTWWGSYWRCCWSIRRRVRMTWLAALTTLLSITTTTGTGPTS